MNYRLNIAPELIWNTDLSCFNKIAGNLISNAFKYTPDKGNICITLYAKNERLILKIANTGKGITPENLGKIFDRYKILDSVEMNGKNFKKRTGTGHHAKAMVTHAGKGEINDRKHTGRTDHLHCKPALAISQRTRGTTNRIRNGFSKHSHRRSARTARKIHPRIRHKQADSHGDR